eukprot:scaffold2529_cov122-Isochrysis_galbana.AAC.9
MASSAFWPSSIVVSASSSSGADIFRRFGIMAPRAVLRSSVPLFKSRAPPRRPTTSGGKSDGRGYIGASDEERQQSTMSSRCPTVRLLSVRPLCQRDLWDSCYVQKRGWDLVICLP